MVRTSSFSSGTSVWFWFVGKGGLLTNHSSVVRKAALDRKINAQIIQVQPQLNYAMAKHSSFSLRQAFQFFGFLWGIIHFAIHSSVLRKRRKSTLFIIKDFWTTRKRKIMTVHCKLNLRNSKRGWCGSKEASVCSSGKPLQLLLPVDWKLSQYSLLLLSGHRTHWWTIHVYQEITHWNWLLFEPNPYLPEPVELHRKCLDPWIRQQQRRLENLHHKKMKEKLLLKDIGIKVEINWKATTVRKKWVQNMGTWMMRYAIELSVWITGKQMTYKYNEAICESFLLGSSSSYANRKFQG